MFDSASGQVFSHICELWLAGSHDGGITSGMYAATNWMQAAAPGEARWGFGIGCRGSVGQSELGATALLKAVWWDFRLASLLTHLFRSSIAITRTVTLPWGEQPTEGSLNAEAIIGSTQGAYT